jgi:curli biogenesis system outer membrane secretion channel CsgG
MKNIAVIALAASLVMPALVRADGPSAPADAAAGGLRFSIGVTKFENHANYSGQFALADTWGSMLTDSLQQTGHFIVLGEADMRDAAMKEQDFAKSGRVAGGDKAPATGFMTPAQLLIKGEITNFQTTSGQHGGVAFGGSGWAPGAMRRKSTPWSTSSTPPRARSWPPRRCSAR